MIELGAEIRPRPVFCVLALERVSRTIAEDACAGRFKHCGVTLRLGHEPDWPRAGLPGDEEWLIECSKFLWGLDLASAFAATGERRFQSAWERLVGSWLERVPAGFDATEIAARRIQNWIYAWQSFAAAPAFTGLGPGLAGSLYDRLADEVTHVRDGLSPERNHRTLELYGLLVAGLAFPELDGELAEWALAELGRNLADDVRADGVHREASTHYHMLVLRSFLGALENARRFDLEPPPGFIDHLVRASEFALHCTRPDGSIPALSDADQGDHRNLLALAASLLDRPDFLYAATSAALGRPPAVRLHAFPSGGYWVQRSGWGEGETAFADERFLIFDCGPLGDGGHGHYDLLSVEAAAGGRRLLVDPGRYTYAEAEPNLRRWFKGTAAHNTITVDRRDQTPYRRGKPKEPVAEGRFLGRTTAPGLDVLRGEARSPCYDAVHTRTVVFVDDAYWLLEDRLGGEAPHRYELRLHLAPEAWGRTAVRDNAVRAPGLALVVDGVGALALEPGWVAPGYGVKLRAPVVVAVVEGVSAVLTTLLAPLSARAPVPGLRVVARDDGSTVEVDRGRVRDTISWNGESAGWSRVEAP